MNTIVIVFNSLGAILIAVVAVRLVVATMSSVMGIVYRREQHAQTCQLLEERIEAVKARRVTDQNTRFAWNGYRKFVIDRKVMEADRVCSFYLVPHDRKPLPEFRPGQFLTFKLDIPGQDKPAVRCYSLSDSPRQDYYRVTIKQVPPPRDQPDIPPGLVSSYFIDNCCEGEILDVKAPGGSFVLNQEKNRPVILLAGGVGITPLLSMINWIAESNSNRETWLFYGVRHALEHAMKNHLQELKQNRKNLNVVTVYSSPGPDEVEGRDYDHQGHLSVSLLRKYFDSNNYEFYVCGPPAMMSSITKQLGDWGVPKSDVHSEAFGPASVKAKNPKADLPAPTKALAAAKVRFDKCSQELEWDRDADNLLEFGEAHGIDLVAGCRAGSCGTCEIAVIQGEIEYNQEPDYPDLKDGCCLTCIGIPKGNVVLDA